MKYGILILILAYCVFGFCAFSVGFKHGQHSGKMSVCEIAKINSNVCNGTGE